MKNQSSQLFTEVITKIPQWDNIPVGTKFKAKIEGRICEGRIQKEDEGIFFCQNERNGQDANDKLGYDHSWNAGNGSLSKLEQNSVEILELELDPQFKPLPKWVGGYIAAYKPVIGRGHVKFGCKTVSNEDIRKLVSMLVD